jgi:hypothetical protein
VNGGDTAQGCGFGRVGGLEMGASLWLN